MKHLTKLFLMVFAIVLASYDSLSLTVVQSLTNSPAMYDYDSNSLTESSWTTFARTETGSITSVSITFTFTTDSWPEEGSMFIKHPDNTTYTLVDLGYVAGQTALLADNSSTTWTLPISTFNGKTPSGTWSVWVEDDYGDGGHAITNASVTINYDAVTPMAYASSTTLQILNAVAPGAVNAPVVALQVVTTGATPVTNATSLTFTTTGTTNPANLLNAKVYYTGTSNAFSTTTPFGSAVLNPNGTFTITGTQALLTGTNYFWLTYDVSSSATLGSLIDATCTSVTVGSTAYIPTITAPTGARTVKASLSGTYNVGPSQTYTTLGAALADISDVGLLGNVTLNITGNTTEATQAALYTPPTGAGFSVTIKPAAGANPVITSTHTGQSLFVSGFNNLTIDGSNTVGGTTRNLTFSQTNTTSTVAHGIFIQSATNAVIKNLNINNGIPSVATSTIVISACNSTTIENCGLTKASYGIIVQNGCNNITITKNNIGSTTAANTISMEGMRFTAGTATYGVTGLTVTDNILNGIIYSGTTASQFQFAMNVGIVYNGTFLRNVIKNVTNSLGHNVGIFVNGVAGTNNLNLLFADNYIGEFIGATSNGNQFGNYILNANNVKFYHNTYNFGTTTSGYYILTNRIAGGTSNISFNNNLMHVDPTSTAKIIHYLDPAQTANPFISLNNNVYNLTSGFSFGYYTSVFHATLAAWGTALGAGANTSDALSKMKIPAFSATGAPWVGGSVLLDAEYVVPLLADVPLDFDKEIRTSANNLAGADIAIPTFNITSNLPPTRIVCEGSSTSYSATAEHSGWADGVARTATGTWSFQWKKNGSNLVPDQYMTVTNNTMTINNSRISHSGNYTLQMTMFNGTVETSVANLDVQAPIVLSTLDPIGACIGVATVTLSINHTGTVTSYQWQKENAGIFQDIIGATGKDYVIPLVDAELVTGNYRVKVFGPGNCGPAEVISNVAPVIITESLSNSTITSYDNPTNICEDSDLKLTANAKGTQTGYKWQVLLNGVWTDISPFDNPSAATQTLVVPMVKPAQSGKYRALIYGSPQCLVNELYTPVLDVTIWPKFKVDYQPESQLLCQNETIRLSVIGVGEISGYQWMKDGKAIDAVANPTATTAFLEIKNAKYENSGTYYCQLTISDCLGANRPANSDVAEVYIMQGTFISKEPDNASVKLGGTARFAVEAHHKGITPPFYKDKFQWFRFNASTNKSTPVADNNRISGSQSSVLSIRNVEAADFAHTGDYYYVVIEGQCGSATSTKAELTERLAETLAIKTQPVAAVACAGTTATMEVEAEASDMAAMLSYQWYLDGGKINDDANYSGTASSKLEIKDIAIYHAGSYTCEVKWNAEGLAEMSAGADLTVNNKPEITTQPNAVVNLQVGRDLELTVVATGGNSYQWYKDGVELTGEMAATYSKQGVAITDGGTYTVKVINDCGDVMSQDAVVTITTGGHTSVVETENGIKLYAVNPNPTKDMGEIRFELTNSSNAKLSLMDAAGREVATLFAGMATAGTNSVRFDVNALGLTSGTYFVTLTSGETRLTTKLMIVK